MTVIPPGAQLGPVDLPPPPPSADPREPSPTAIRGRSSRTPQRARSPAPVYGTHHAPTSRGASPSRPPAPHQSSSDASLPIIQPVPKHASSVPLIPHAPIHLSRPSSPASIHSSSSAIFERDIELPAVGSLSIHPNAPTQTLSHKSSRLSQFSHGSALDHTVPAVLDDAVEALQGQGKSGGIEGVEIEAPVTPLGVGMTRQSSASAHGIGSGRKTSTGAFGALGSFGSRSPSPASVGSPGSSGITSPARSPPILSQLATQHQTASASPASSSPTSLMSGMSGAVPRPAMAQRTSTGPQLPGGWAFGHDKPSEAEKQDPIEETATSPPPLPHAPSAPAAIPSHLTPTKDKRRISYISYNDLLLSVPTTVTPLGEITSGATSPDHLPGNISPSVPSRSPVMASSVSSGSHNASTGPKEDPKACWDAGASGRAAGLGMGEGEWEREGLGKGLEQRLEDLVREDGSPEGAALR